MKKLSKVEELELELKVYKEFVVKALDCVTNIDQFRNEHGEKYACACGAIISHLSCIDSQIEIEKTLAKY